MNPLPNLLDHLPLAWRVLSSEPAGLITDVDGTISPIVARPEAAGVDPRARRLLEGLVGHLELVAALSGRRAAEAAQLVAVPDMVYVGNHGLEWWEEGGATIVPEARVFQPAVTETVAWLRRRLHLPGVLVEDKGITGAVHYRLAADPSGAREAILEAVENCPSARYLRVAHGRMVVNILPPIPADKGTAVQELVRRRSLRGALYLGDDVTDVDAFRALRSLRDSGVCQTLAVAVISPEAPSDLAREGDCALDGVEAVVRFLEAAVGWCESRGRRR